MEQAETARGLGHAGYKAYVSVACVPLVMSPVEGLELSRALCQALLRASVVENPQFSQYVRIKARKARRGRTHRAAHKVRPCPTLGQNGTNGTALMAGL